MKLEVTNTDSGVVIGIKGVLKKADGMQVADEILKVAKSRPKTLILDCSELAAVSFDSVPFIVSALERARLGKNNVVASGCNNVIERTFRGSDFERVGKLESA